MNSDVIKISIIIPTLNSEKTLERCLLSVVNQTYKNFECIVIDGLSTDHTKKIVLQMMEVYPYIQFVSGKDSGIYNAMNKGLGLARGEWVYFLGSDDSLFNEHVFEKIFFGEDINGFDYVYGDVLWGDTDLIYDGKFTPTKLIQKNICHQAIFVRKKILLHKGGFQEKYRSLADWDMNLRIFVDESIRKRYVNVVIAKYSLGGFSCNFLDSLFLKEGDAFKKENFPEEYRFLKQLKLLQREIAKKDQEITERERELVEKDQMLAEKDREVTFVKSSKFWRIRNCYINFIKKISL